MTNKTSEVTTSLTTKNERSGDKTSMQSLDELFGTYHYKTQTLFEVDGKELVHIAHHIWGRTKLYLDGEQIFEGWSLARVFCLPSDTIVEHQGVEYRVLSCVTNWVSYTVKVTIIVNDAKAQSKTISVLEGLKGCALLHAIAGPLFAGLIFGSIFGLSQAVFNFYLTS